MRFLIPLIAFVAPMVSAIAFTDPAGNATLTKGRPYDLTWTTVDTDPTTFSVYLVNFVNWPPFYTPLVTNIETSLGEYSVRIPCDVDSSYGFQFNAINGTNLYVIYAQSPNFSIGGAACTDPTTTASTCAPAATVTVTVSKTPAKSTITPASAASSAPTSVSHGTVPNTVGWKTPGYVSPVVLPTVPTPGQPKITTPPTTLAKAMKPTPTNSIFTVWETVYASLEDCACTE